MNDKKILRQLEKAKKASIPLGFLSHTSRVLILKNLAKGLRRGVGRILRANAKDLRRFPEDTPLRDRLLLNKTHILDMAREVEALARMPDPIGKIYDCRQRHGLQICRKRVPIGVIAVIYESRPNVTVDTAAVCIKSGNAVILKSGKESRESSRALYKIIKKSLALSGAHPDAVQFIDPKIKNSVSQIVSAEELIDAVIPRGGKNLIDFVRRNAVVPVIETGSGVCHTYVDDEANLEKSARVVWNAKTSRPSVCNALDTVVVHRRIAGEFLPKMAKRLVEKEVEIFADADSFKILKNIYPKNLLRRASPRDFGREFLTQKISIKIVRDIDEAIKFISRHSSKHSEAILTENKNKAERFLREVDAGVVYLNASTRFSDAAVFGLGPEVGVSTDKLHARGPMGAEAMTTYKWVVVGKYNVRIISHESR